ncbi:hypothetical protein GCM10009087_32990 [Sphingomonas oligophenolica]|uniref:DUF4274 domain-containing protein n=1 Tax=Sphingomonas oligophenolica TaxID=301154 RepID=A0ABU9XYI5_9SPHN
MLPGSSLESVVHLRPGMSKAEAERVLASGKMTLEEKGGLSQPFSVQYDLGRVVNIRFGSDFPSAIKIYGIGIGMPLDVVKSSYASVEHVSDDAWFAEPHQRFRVQMPNDGYEMAIVIFEGKVAAIDFCGIGRIAMIEKNLARRRVLMEGQQKLQKAVDPDQQLQLWAETQTGLAPAKQIGQFIAWLPTAHPDEWHGVAASWNWDFGVQPLRWIVSQRECGIATAALIFFDGEPLDAEHDSSAGTLLAEIRARWPNFPDNGVAYCPPRYVDDIGDHHLNLIPLDMRQSRPGRDIASTAYHEGIPIAFFQSD